MNALTLIMAARDEGDEPALTCASALESPGAPVEVLVMDDGSRIPVPPIPNVRVRRSDAPWGLFESKRIGVALASSAVVVVCDAHVRFSPGWAAAMLDASLSKPDAVHVALCRSLRSDFKDTQSGLYWGANLMVRGWGTKTKRDPKGVETREPELKWLEGIWQSAAREGAVPCPMGSAYCTTKGWWERVDMLAGLQAWGGQEPDMALRTWLSGGEVLLLPSVTAAHVFRKKAPYPADGLAVRRNRMWMAAVLLPEDVGGRVLAEMTAKFPGAARGLDLVAARRARARFDEVRRAGAWEGYIGRFPAGVILDWRDKP